MTENDVSPRSLFEPEPGSIYLDAATYGLPPRQTVDSLQRAIERWQAGTADWIKEWDREGDRCRELFAVLIGASADEIALVPSVSAGVGTIAASLPEGTEVLVPEMEFTSVLFPLLVARDHRQVRVREVPFDRLADEIRPGTGLVAFSLSRSQDGATAPLAEIVARANAVGARLLVDATHAIPFIEVAPEIRQIDYLVCHGYKHLLCPRGVGFLYLRRDRIGDIAPWNANWRGAVSQYGRSLGGTLDLSPSAARFDVSLAWHAWVGARQSLELIVRWRANGELARAVDLARRLAALLELPPPAGSIVGVEVPDADKATAALAAAGVRCAARAGRIRLSTHVYNTDEDIDRAAAAVAPVL